MASKNNEEGSSSVGKNVVTVNSVDDERFLAALANYNIQEIRPRPEMMSKLKDKLISSNSKGWTQEEDTLLQGLLKKYERVSDEIARYTKIAKDLKTKSIFDVVGRVMWLNSKKESEGKRS